MKNIYHRLTKITWLAVVFTMALSVSAQVRPYRVTDNQIQTLLNRIETRTDTFRRQIERIDNRRDTQRTDQLMSYVTDFENATDSLNSNFTSRRSSANDVQEVLGRAAVINNYLRSTRINNAAQSQWNQIVSDLNTLASYYRVSWNWDRVPTYPNSPVYNVPDSQVQALLRRIENQTDTFRNQVARIDNRRDSRMSEQLVSYVTDFENATDRLSSNFTSRRSSANDVEEVLNRASVIDSYMRNNRFNNAAESQWNQIRTDLNTLANYYRVSWNWDRTPTYPNYPGNNNARLTGTYRLNTSLSDNVSTVVNREVSDIRYNANQRDRVRRNLERRLMSPDMLVIEQRGNQVTMASTNSRQVSFEADGTARSETNVNGRTMQTRASISGGGLTIDYEGDRMNDFYISMMPMNNGQLRVTRRVYLENRNETVTVNSVYDQISPVARWNDIDYQNNNPNTGGNYGDFVVPNNTRLTATLDTPLSTRTARDGDRFSMTVTSPGQYQGAVIEGRVNGSKSGVVSGRANLSMDFETIRLRNGSTYNFAGIVDQVREPDGDTVSVNNEGTIRDSNQTTKTVTRAGIGAVLGAIIGGIAGGGEGAAIGAGIGAGAGAGSVILQGRDNLELPSGTQFTLTATAPYNR